MKPCLSVTSSLLLSFLCTHADGIKLFTDTAPVKFYVYESPGWLKKCDKSRMKGTLLLPDVAMHYKLAKHPWRVQDPSEASFFFVPAYITLSNSAACGGAKAHEDNMKELVRMMDSSPWFNRSQGADHVISGFMWNIVPDTFGEFAPYAKRMIVGRFENNYRTAHFPNTFTIPYGPVSAKPYMLPRTPLSARSHSFFFMGSDDVRPAYRTRAAAFKQLKDFPDIALVDAVDFTWAANANKGWDDNQYLTACKDDGPWNGCKADRDWKLYGKLGQDSKCFLIIHGTTPSTSRLYDAFAFGAIPIIISKDFDVAAKVWPLDMPWQKFSVTVDQSDFEQNASEVLTRALPVALNKYEEVMQYRQAFTWTARGDCLASALASHVGRTFLNRTRLVPASRRDECGPHITKEADPDPELADLAFIFEDTFQ